MQNNEILNELKIWEKKVTSADKVYQDLREFYHASPECPVFNAIFEPLEAYTKTLEWALTGVKNSDWLFWYWLENNMGEKGLEANPGTWDTDREITSLSDLAELVTETKQAEDGEKHMVVVHVTGGTVQQVLASYNTDEAITTVVDFDCGDVKEKEELLKNAQENLNVAWQ